MIIIDDGSNDDAEFEWDPDLQNPPTPGQTQELKQAAGYLNQAAGTLSSLYLDLMGAETVPKEADVINELQRSVALARDALEAMAEDWKRSKE